MMGNLLSFVVLCILNRVCIEWAWEEEYLSSGGRKPYRDRKVRLNGDDIVFCGDEGLYRQWREQTAKVGFVVNEGKTGRSAERIELNSEIYLRSKKRFVRKLNFGWLRPSDNDDSLASAIFETLDRISWSNACALLGRWLTRRALTRSSIKVAEVPRKWWNRLVKRWWFRSCVLWGPGGEAIQIGSERTVPIVEGPLIDSGLTNDVRKVLEGRIRKAERVAVEWYVASWRGKLSCPLEKRRGIPRRDLPRTNLRGSRRWRIVRGGRKWVRMWIRPVRDWFCEAYPWAVRDGRRVYADAWEDEQPGLRTTVSYAIASSGERPPRTGGFFVGDDEMGLTDPSERNHLCSSLWGAHVGRCSGCAVRETPQFPYQLGLSLIGQLGRGSSDEIGWMNFQGGRGVNKVSTKTEGQGRLKGRKTNVPVPSDVGLAEGSPAGRAVESEPWTLDQGSPSGEGGFGSDYMTWEEVQARIQIEVTAEEEHETYSKPVEVKLSPVLERKIAALKAKGFESLGPGRLVMV